LFNNNFDVVRRMVRRFYNSKQIGGNMSKRLFQVILTLILGTLFVFGDAICLYAQETKAEEFTLEEITVTAQKRSENQQKVAIAMDVIAADELKSAGKSDIDDILSNVSNVMVQKSADGMRVSLRGYSDSGGTNHGQSTSTPAVAVNQDGVYSSRKDGGSDLYDIDRVEVLFGPQSTMYASNSPGGIVNVETAKPKIDKYEASGTLEFGNFNLLHTEGMVNVPLNSIMSLRTAFQTKNHDGYISNGGDDEDSKSGRLKMLLQPNDKFSFNVTGELVKSTTHMSGSSVTGFVNQKDVDNPWTSTQEIGNPNHDTTKKVTGRVDWDLGVTSVSVVSAYSTHKGDRDEKMAFGPSPDHWLYATHGNEKSVEVRFASSTDFFFKWLVGFNYYKSNDWLSGLNYDTTGAVKTGLARNMYTGVVSMTEQFRTSGSLEDAKALFINMTYPVTETFRATGGIRKSWDKFNFINNEIRGLFGNPDVSFEDTTGMNNSMSYSKPDYKLGVEYDLGKNSMTYADYSTSYRVQAFGGGKPGASASTHEEYPPEMLKAYTVGAKNRFLDNTLQLNAAAFWYDYRNFAAGDMVMGYSGKLTADGQIDPAAFDGNAVQPDQNGSTYGDGKWYGLDIQSTYLIGGDDSVNLSLSYLHSEWTNLVFDYASQWRLKSGVMLGPGQAAQITDFVPADTVSYNGKSMTNSPEWTVSLSYTHKFNFESGASIDARIDSKYKSGYRMSWKDADYPYNYQEAFINGDVTGTYYSADGKYTVSGYVKNVRDYAEKRAYFSGAGVELRIGSPRTYGAVISVKF
jgi:iron complex outermembrane recepter protein